MGWIKKVAHASSMSEHRKFILALILIASILGIINFMQVGTSNITYAIIIFLTMIGILE